MERARKKRTTIAQTEVLGKVLWPVLSLQTTTDLFVLSALFQVPQFSSCLAQSLNLCTYTSCTSPTPLFRQFRANLSYSRGELVLLPGTSHQGGLLQSVNLPQEAQGLLWCLVLGQLPRARGLVIRNESKAHT